MTQHVPSGWPRESLDPGSDFFIPEHLRGYYRVDDDKEARLQRRVGALNEHELHMWRLNEAGINEANVRRAREEAARHRVEHTCQVCNAYHRRTREAARFVAGDDDPHDSQLHGLSGAVCPTCMEFVRQQLSDEAGEQLLTDGRTRRDAVADFIRRNRAGGEQS